MIWSHRPPDLHADFYWSAYSDSLLGYTQKEIADSLNDRTWRIKTALQTVRALTEAIQ